MKQYWIRVTRDEKGRVISLYSPDFKCELVKENSDDADSIHNNFRSYAFKVLIDRFPLAIHKVTPKTLKQLKSTPLTSLQHWECIMIVSSKKRGFFSRALPVLGHASNAIAILAGAFITFMALRVASSHNQENSDPTRSNALSISGAVFGSIMALVMYVFSGASKMLAGIGRWMDTSTSNIIDRIVKRLKKPIAKNDVDNEELTRVESKNSAPNCCSCQTIVKTLLAGGTVACVLGNTVITSVSQYQETNLLTDRYLDLYPDMTPAEREQSYQLLWWLVVITYVFTMAFSGLAFQGGFAEQLLKKASDKLLGQKAESPVNSNEINSEKNPLLLNSSDANDSIIIEPESTLANDEQPQILNLSMQT